MIVVKTKNGVHYINEMNVTHVEFDTEKCEVGFRFVDTAGQFGPLFNKTGLDRVFIQEVISVDYLVDGKQVCLAENYDIADMKKTLDSTMEKLKKIKKRNHDYNVIHSYLYRLRMNFIFTIEAMKDKINNREDMPQDLKESLLNRLENMENDAKKRNYED